MAPGRSIPGKVAALVVLIEGRRSDLVWVVALHLDLIQDPLQAVDQVF